MFNEGFSNIWEYIHSLNTIVIMPFSKFYIVWTGILILSALYNIFYVPFSISFGYNSQGLYLIFDIILNLVINFLDIIIHAKTAIKIRLGISFVY